MSNVRVLNHDSSKAPVQIQDCRGLSVRDVLMENVTFKGAALLLENCDEATVDGFTLRGETNILGSAVCFRITKESFSGLRISNVSARNVGEAGILLEAKQKGTLTDYLITGNLATVIDRIEGARAVITNNLK